MNLHALLRRFLMPLGFLTTVTTLWNGSPSSAQPLPGAISGAVSRDIPSTTDASPPDVLSFVRNEGGEVYALVSKDGRLLYPPRLLAVTWFQPDGKGGYIAAARSENGKWGYLNEEGAWVVEPELDLARQHAKDGLARFQRGEAWGFIDLAGREVVPASFKYVRPFRSGLAAVGTERGWSYLDLHGEIAIRGPFGQANEFSSFGLAPATPKRGKKWGYIDRSGKFVIKAQFEGARPFGPGGTAPVAIEKEIIYNGEKLGFSQTLWGLIDLKGNWVLEPKYLTIKKFDAEGLAAFADIPIGGLGESGYLDAEGTIVLSGWRLSDTRRCGLVRDDYASGRFLKLNGEPLTKKSFTWASDFTENCISIALQEKTWGILSQEGRFLKLPQYVEPLTDANGSLVDHDRPDGLVPWLTKEGGIAFLASSGEERFHLSWSERGETSTVDLVDSQGKVLWSEDAETSSVMRAQALLTPEAIHHFVDPAYGEGDLMGVIDRLRQAKSRLFYPVSRVFDSRTDAYDIEELRADFQDEELKELLNYGAIETLASTYVGEGLWGQYEYLSYSYSELYPSYLERLSKDLSEVLGQPLKNPPVGDLRLSDGPSNSSRVWAVDGRYLVLDLYSDVGDGDFSYGLFLALVDEKVPSL